MDWRVGTGMKGIGEEIRAKQVHSNLSVSGVLLKQRTRTKVPGGSEGGERQREVTYHSHK